MDVVIGWQDYTAEFHGEKITMKIRPLTRRGMMIISPYFKHFTATEKEAVKMIDEAKANGEDLTHALAVARVMAEKDMDWMYELQGRCEEVFADHLKDIEGILINGKEPTLQQFANESIFCNLCIEIVLQLMGISTVTVTDAKN